MLPHDVRQEPMTCEAHLLGVLQYVAEPHILCSPQGAVLAMNAAARRVFPRQGVIEDALRTVPLGTHHLTVVWRGPVREVTVTRSAVRLPDGTQARLTRIHQPPARLEAGAELRGQQRLLDALPSRAVLLDAAGVIQAANVRWRVAVRESETCTADDGVGSPYLSLSASIAGQPRPADAPAMAAGLRDVLARRALAFECTYTATEAGAPTHYQFSAAALDDTSWTLVTQTNVTEARLAAAREYELAAHFQAVFDHAVDGIVIADDDGRCVEVNHAAASMLDTEGDRLRGASLRSLHDEFDAMWPGLLAAGEKDGTLTLTADGRPRLDIDYAARARFFPGRHLLVLRDVTASRRAEERLRQAQKMEAIGQLASGIAHDFNNLLTVVIGNVAHVSDMLTERAADDGSIAGPTTREAEADLTRVMRAAERGADLVKKLLAFGRKQRFDPVVLSLDAFLGEMSVVLRHLLPESIRLQVRTEQDVAVRADPVALQQVIFNLVTNARDAIGVTDGAIDLLLARRSAASIDWLPAADRHGACAMLQVRDNGHGMDAETLRHVCEPFFTTKDVGQGTGLGMAMVYGLVQQHGGHMRVESTPGKGTTITVLLPVVAVAEALPSELPQSSRALPVEGHECVLIVEDKPAVREVASRVLGLAGYRVLTAQDGEDAAAVLSLHGTGVDLVMSDVVMPGGGGAAVVQAMRDFAPAARLLFTSGYPSRPSEVATLPLPDVPMLQKPWTPAQLRATARRILDERHA